jgi:hypothetical protein
MMSAPAAPRGALRNWQPAETIGDYVRNCNEGLEQYSSSRAAALLGWSRVQLYRARLIAELPKVLFEKLLDHGVLSSRELANVALAFQRGENGGDAERCPHCGGVVRVRWKVGKAARDAIRAWLDEGAP